MEELTVKGWSAWLAGWDWPGERRERSAVQTALGRVLAQPVKAVREVPPGPVAAVSGLAVAADRTGAGVYLKFGTDAQAVRPGQQLPAGCDAILEPLDYLLSDDSVWVVDAVPSGRGVRPAGGELAAGQLVLPAGQTLTGPALVACLAAGVTRVEVVRRPRLAIFPYGGEWSEPAARLDAGQVPETGSLMLAAAAQEWGAEPQVNPIVANEEQLAERLALAARSADILAVIDSSRQTGAAWALTGDKPCLYLPGLPDQLWLAGLRWLHAMLAHWYGRQNNTRPVAEVTLARPLYRSPAGCLLLAAQIGELTVAWPLPGVLGGHASAVTANAMSSAEADRSADDLIVAELLEPAELLRHRVLLAAPPTAAAAVAPPVLTPSHRVHVLAMSDGEATAACEAGFVHGRLEERPDGWALHPAPAIAASALHELLQAAFAQAGPAAPGGWVG